MSTDVLTPSGGGNGFAQIEGPFPNLTINPLSPLAGLSAIQFGLNPEALHADYTFDILVNFVGGSQLFSTYFAPNNKFDILVDGNEVISSITASHLLGKTSNQDARSLTTSPAFVRFRSMAYWKIRTPIPRLQSPNRPRGH